MTRLPPTQRPVPVPLWRRGAALGIDALGVGLISSFMGVGWAQLFVFGVGWLGMRVVLVSRNRGQSLGRWAMDMRILDGGRGGTPTLQDLTKRELGLGIVTFWAFWGITHLSPTTAWALLLLIPLGGDAIFALNGSEWGLTLHDRFARTFIVESRRGYSLDMKVQKLVADLRSRMKK
ncbi:MULTISPECIES: RDD family protein [unclassified Leptolyngbya]|uniref:RDD family protein n=1 Tax=unclassified Leptolyngbya TaxID=2650499 RepID=UPI00168389C3|nr:MULTISPECIES: RDD family protein [unclassified Leptolyngbya]MBD1910625.1 RDD family protein [Leptolyngbya sp. FACHB-8]MBD2154565.1 RDD family protein [Leptolyngbya sp. FACHB-16]